MRLVDVAELHREAEVLVGDGPQIHVKALRVHRGGTGGGGGHKRATSNAGAHRGHGEGSGGDRVGRQAKARRNASDVVVIGAEERVVGAESAAPHVRQQPAVRVVRHPVQVLVRYHGSAAACFARKVAPGAQVHVEERPVVNGRPERVHAGLRSRVQVGAAGCRWGLGLLVRPQPLTWPYAAKCFASVTRAETLAYVSGPPTAPP